MTQIHQEQMDRNLDQVACLAANIYHEARGESFEGQVAVAQVTLNRVKDSRFPKTVCDVVYERKQFSWTSNRSKVIANTAAWNSAYDIADNIINGRLYHSTLENTHAVFYHAVYVFPRWTYTKIATIGHHTFYASN